MSDSSPPTLNLGAALGLLLIRLWLGVRTLLAGVEKFAGARGSEELVEIDGAPNAYGLTEGTTEKFYALSNYRGVPEGLAAKFEAEPLLPGWALGIYDRLLGPALLLLGLLVLLGIARRVSLFAMGLLYTSLTVGLVLIHQDGGVAWLGTHVVLIAVALIYADQDRFALAAKKW